MATVDSLLELQGSLGEEAEEQVDERHLSEISHRCNCQWKTLHPCLELPTDTKDAVEQEIGNLDASEDEEGKRLVLLSKWKDAKGSEATYKLLVGALLQAGCKDDAEMVCELIQPMPVESQLVSSSDSASSSLGSVPIAIHQVPALHSSQTFPDPVSIHLDPVLVHEDPSSSPSLPDSLDGSRVQNSPKGQLEPPSVTKIKHPGVIISPSPLLGRRGVTAIPSTPETNHADDRFLWFMSNSDVTKGSEINLLDSSSASQLQQRDEPDFGSLSMVNLERSPKKDMLATKSSIDVSHGTDTLMLHSKRKRTAIQRSTFTNWVNDRLQVGKSDRRVEDLFVDLKDGILLIKLLENLTKKKVAGFTGKTPKTEAHKIVNLDLAFKFMQAENIKMVGVGGMNIYRGDITLTLGMIWMLIQKYQMRMKGYKVSTKQVMIGWLQALLPKWNITNLTSDWKDGRALIAIINAVKPGIAMSATSLDPTAKRQNCILATKIAQSYLKIPQIISPQDLSSGNVDERSIMTYLSYFVEPFRAKLLKWVQRMLPEFDITRFSEDWHSGRVFGAMVKACCAAVFSDWDQLERSSDEEYVDKLFRNVKRKLGLTPPFKTGDLVSGNVEDIQIMTMVMLIRNADLVPLSDEVVVSGRGIEEANLHEEASFLVNITEAGPGELFIDAFYEEDDHQLKFGLMETSNKIYRLTYTPVRTGKVVFDIQWSKEAVPQSPFVVPVTDSTLVSIVDFESHSTVVEAGKPLSLLLDAEKAGSGRLTAYLQYGREKIQAEASTLPNGNIELGYTPTKSGTYVLHILWNQKELHHLAVTYTVVDVGGYAIESPPQDKVHSVFQEFGFWVLADNGLPFSVLEMTAILSLDVQIPINFQAVDENRAYACFTPTLPGVYRIEVVCIDQLIHGTPFDIQVSDPHSCKVKGDIPAFLELGKPFVFEVNTKEAGVGALTFDSSDHDISSLFEVQLKRPDTTDLQKLEVTPLVEGSFLVGIKYEDKWISNSPFRLQICDPSKFQVVEKLTAAGIGRPIEFTVKARERCTSDVKLYVKASGPSAKYTPQIQLSENGLEYFVKFIPWEIGDHEISIQYGVFDIPSSPIVLPVTSFDADACSAAGSGLQRAYSGVPARFLVLSRQQGLLDDNTLKIRVVSVIDNNECSMRARDNRNGTYSIAYLIQNPGAYLISIITAGQHIPGSPFKLNALPGPDAHQCRMYGPALEEDTILTFGRPIEFTVDTANAGMGKLSVKAIGPEGTPARVFLARTDQPGRYDVNIDVLRHGKHRVNVKWSNSHIPGSPFMIKVFPGADSRKCLAYGPGLEDGWVGKKSAFTIDTKSAGAGVLKVRLHGVKDAFKIEMAPIDQKNRRTMLANYNPTLPGEYLITIMWSEMHVPGSPFRVKITGDGTAKAPTTFYYTPTPRLPEVSGFLADSEELEENEDEERRVSAVQRPVLKQQPRQPAPVKTKKRVRKRKRREAPKPARREYAGQVILRVKK